MRRTIVILVDCKGMLDRLLLCDIHRRLLSRHRKGDGHVLTAVASVLLRLDRCPVTRRDRNIGSFLYAFCRCRHNSSLRDLCACLNLAAVRCILKRNGCRILSTFQIDRQKTCCLLRRFRRLCLSLWSLRCLCLSLRRFCHLCLRLVRRVLRIGFCRRLRLCRSRRRILVYCLDGDIR